MAGKAKKLTIPVIDKLTPKPGGGHRVVRDAEVPGLQVRVAPTGRKSFVFSYRLLDGRASSLKLGALGEITLAQARELARDAAFAVRGGRDPARERAALRQGDTVADFAERYFTEHVSIHNSPSWRDEVRRLLDKLIIPRLGKLKIAVVATPDVAKFHRSMTATPGQANLALACVSKLMAYAKQVGARPAGDNPCSAVQRFPTRKRERFLSADELARLGEVLRSGRVAPNAVLALKLLLFTGGRLSEVLGARWDWVDLANGAIHLPTAKTGARDLHLGAAAIGLLLEEKKRGSGPFIIPGRKPGASMTPSGLEKVWARLRSELGMPDVHLHDLRHTAGTYAGMSGANQFLVRDFLGHKGVAMTSQYVNKYAPPVQQLADTVSSKIAGLLDRADQADVIPLKRGA